MAFRSEFMVEKWNWDKFLSEHFVCRCQYHSISAFPYLSLSASFISALVMVIFPKLFGIASSLCPEFIGAFNSYFSSRFSDFQTFFLPSFIPSFLPLVLFSFFLSAYIYFSLSLSDYSLLSLFSLSCFCYVCFCYVCFFYFLSVFSVLFPSVFPLSLFLPSASYNLLFFSLLFCT